MLAQPGTSRKATVEGQLTSRRPTASAPSILPQGKYRPRFHRTTHRLHNGPAAVTSQGRSSGYTLGPWTTRVGGEERSYRHLLPGADQLSHVTSLQVSPQHSEVSPSLYVNLHPNLGLFPVFHCCGAAGPRPTPAPRDSASAYPLVGPPPLPGLPPHFFSQVHLLALCERRNFKSWPSWGKKLCWYFY